MSNELKAQRPIGGINGDAEYWAALARGEFRISQCAHCGKWIWPAHFRCAACGSWDIKWTQVEPIGTIYSWTRNWYAFERLPERAGDVPYVCVLAELPHVGGARVLGMLIGDEEKLRIGAPVRGEIQPPSTKTRGHATICWRITG